MLNTLTRINTIRLAGMIEDSIVDGPGIRTVVFMQGCKHHCQNCHNPKTHDLMSGELVSISSILSKIKNNSLLDGVTISGGEPFLQIDALHELVMELRKLPLNILIYTGYTLEELQSKNNGTINEILRNIDYLIDGRYIHEQRSLSIPFRGSLNQRFINIRSTLKQQRIIEY